MKKIGKTKSKSLFLILIIGLFSYMPMVSAKTFDICQKNGIMKSIEILSIALFILKILVPILLIAMGCIEFGKAALSSDEGAIKTAASSMAKKAIAAVVVFFIPTIIWFVAEFVENITKTSTSNFNCVSVCIKDYRNCVIPGGGLFGKAGN